MNKFPSFSICLVSSNFFKSFPICMVILSPSDPSATNKTSICSLVSSAFGQFLLLFTMNMSVEFNFLPVKSNDLAAITFLKLRSTSPQNLDHVYFIVTFTYTFGSGGFSVGSGLLACPLLVALNDDLFTANTPSLPLSISLLTMFPALPLEMPSASRPFTPSTNLDSVIRLPHFNFVIVNSHSLSSNPLIPQICLLK